MRIKVIKFGGTSVATPESRLLAARKVVNAREAGYWPVVVVSAIGRKGSPYATDTLLSLLRDVDPLVPPDARELDLMLCCGEIMSTCIFAQTLKSLGHPASAMTGGQAGLVTDINHGEARILYVKPDDVLRNLQMGRIPVVCGFQGRSEPHEGAVYGEITTLGRGGSDTTASALGAALKAEVVEIYTDVDGVKTCDPNMVPEAPTLGKMTYEEIAEIAHQGAKVVHPRAAEIAMKFGIPLWIKSTFTEQAGTEVVPKEQFPGRRVTGVTHTGKLVYLQFDASFGNDKAALEARVYELMADYKVNLFMLNSHPNSFGFAVPRKQLSKVKGILDGLVVPMLNDAAPRTYIVQIGRSGSEEVCAQTKMLKETEAFGEIRNCIGLLTENCTMVSLIAHDYLQQPGIFLKTLECLDKASIAPLQASDSLYALSILVSESDCDRAVRALHDEFELSEIV